MAKRNADEVLTELQPIFREALDTPDLTVTRASKAQTTPNWDSLAHIGLIEMVESHFGIRIGLSELEDMKNVGDLVDVIVAKAR